jgi:hypothetical protein
MIVDMKIKKYFTKRLIVCAILILLAIFAPIPYYLSNPIVCTPNMPCPTTHVGWNFGASLWQRIQRYEHPSYGQPIEDNYFSE